MVNTISRVSSLKRKYGKRYFQRMGRLGGLTTVELYGTNFMSLIASLKNTNLSKARIARIRREIAEVLSY